MEARKDSLAAALDSLLSLHEIKAVVAPGTNLSDEAKTLSSQYDASSVARRRFNYLFIRSQDQHPGLGGPSILAIVENETLIKKLDQKGNREWPRVRSGLRKVAYSQGSRRWREISESVSLSARYDDGHGLGFSLGFPFLLVRNVEMYLVKGWLAQKVSITWNKDRKGFLRNRVTNVWLDGPSNLSKDSKQFLWQVVYAHSASRFVDWYGAFGFEWYLTDPQGKLDYRSIEGNEKFDFGGREVSELGVKVRGNIGLPDSWRRHLRWITWSKFAGITLGVRSGGLQESGELEWVFELGGSIW